MIKQLGNCVKTRQSFGKTTQDALSSHLFAQIARQKIPVLFGVGAKMSKIK